MATRIRPGVDVARTEQQLELIGEVGTIAAELEVQVWLRGGWAVDFFLGEVTRDHVDIDWFAWATDAVALEDRLLRRGYRQVGSAPPEQQLDVVRDGPELSFAWLARDGSQVVVAGGPWGGQPWPPGLLDAAPGRIGRLVCPIIGPAAQIEIKQMMPVWVPGRPRRAKDAEDVARLRAALHRGGGGWRHCAGAPPATGGTASRSRCSARPRGRSCSTPWPRPELTAASYRSTTTTGTSFCPS